jgi:DNA-binding transcriptional LysR family regulator
VKLKNLHEQKFIAFERDIPTRRAVDRLLRANGAVVEPVMEFDNVETVKRAVEIGSGVAIVPEATVRQEVASHTLAAVKLDGAEYFRPLAAIYKKNKVLSPALKQLLALLKSTL